jgi:acyl carrier protein
MSTTTQVRAILASILQIDAGNELLGDQAPLLGAIPEFDSMAVVSVITSIEEQFGFSIDDDEIDAAVFESVGTLSAFVNHKLQHA